MTSPDRIILVVLAGWLVQPVCASDANSVLEDHASSLLAVQLSSEVANELREEFLEHGKSLEDADALVFHVVDDAADCAVAQFRANKMPQIQSYLDLLVRNEEMSSVLGALDKIYETSELDEMQSEIARVVQECLASSKVAIAAS